MMIGSSMVQSSHLPAPPSPLSPLTHRIASEQNIAPVIRATLIRKVASPTPARLHPAVIARVNVPPRPSSAAPRESASSSIVRTASPHLTRPRSPIARPASACTTTRPSKTFLSSTVSTEMDAQPISAPQAVHRSTPAFVYNAPMLSDVDKPLPAVKEDDIKQPSPVKRHHLSPIVTGMPTPPQTPDVIPVTTAAPQPNKASEQQQRWLATFCKRRHSIPRTLKKLVRASFATTTTTIVSASEPVAIQISAPLQAQSQHSAAGPPSSAATAVDLLMPSLSLGASAHEAVTEKSSFDPTQDISLSFLETVPTYRLDRPAAAATRDNATPAKEQGIVMTSPQMHKTAVDHVLQPPVRRDSPSPSMMRPQVPPRVDTPSPSDDERKQCTMALQQHDDMTSSSSTQDAAARKRRKSRARVVRPDIAYKSILKTQSKFDTQAAQEAVHPQKELKQRSSELPTPPSRSPTKSFRFNEQVLVGETWPKMEYERKSHFMLQLTPHKAYQIKKELNDFKRDEMAVHEDSRCYTHFFH